MKDFVKKVYGEIATSKTTDDCSTTCCSCNAPTVSEKIGYSREELRSIPNDANMGLGCGNPVAIASLKEGETVVDLGSGGGIDAFLASKYVGDTGKVIGIDMTEEMIQKATSIATRAGFANVEFKLGDIEHIPLEDSIADCVISNCVINLAKDKQRAFNEAYRILKPGGRIMVSDIVILEELPGVILESAKMYAWCIAGALEKNDYLDKIKKASFKNIKINREAPVYLSDYAKSDIFISSITRKLSKDEIDHIDNSVISVKISAEKE